MNRKKSYCIKILSDRCGEVRWCSLYSNLIKWRRKVFIHHTLRIEMRKLLLPYPTFNISIIWRRVFLLRSSFWYRIYLTSILMMQKEGSSKKKKKNKSLYAALWSWWCHNKSPRPHDPIAIQSFSPAEISIASSSLYTWINIQFFVFILYLI